MQRKLLWQIPFLLLLIVGTVLILRQQHAAQWQHNEGPVFGTAYHVTYQSPADLGEELLAALHEVDASLSMFNPQSTIARVNRGDTAGLTVDSLLVEVFTLAARVAADTGGAFDPTVAPLVNAWGFGTETAAKPQPQTIDSIRAFVGFGKATLADGRIKKQDPRLMLDFSAIAKGYGADRVARLLARRGVSNYMVEIGGEVVVGGVNKEGKPWRVGIDSPDAPSEATSRSLQAVLELSDCALATSGNYRNYREDGTRRYAHTIDPRTGYPVQRDIISATVKAPACALADAYATAFMVIGLDEARRLLSRHKELAAYIVYTAPDGTTDVWTNMTESAQ